MALKDGFLGEIEIFDDFCGPEWIIAETAASGAFGLGHFRVIGQGTETNDSGVTVNETAPCLSGVARLTTTDEDNHSCGLTTGKMFAAGVNGPLVLETRVQFDALDTMEFFFGLSNQNDDTEILEGGVVGIATTAATTVAYTATNVCGFLISSEATDDEDWHVVYKGGTADSGTDSTALDLNTEAVLADWQVLRLEVDTNGDARWYIDGILKKTVAGAVSTTTALAAQAILHNLANTAAPEACDLDYILVRASRDWTV